MAGKTSEGDSAKAGTAVRLEIRTMSVIPHLMF